jgi:hypothetical protein
MTLSPNGLRWGYGVRWCDDYDCLIIPFFYQSGEQVEPGDRVRLHGESGEIEFVADPADDPNNWYVEKFGGGVMVVEPKVVGRLFIGDPVSDYEDLEFVSRSV